MGGGAERAGGRPFVPRTVARVAARIVIYLALIWGAIFLFQDRLLYLPTPAPLAEVVAEARREGLSPWPASGDYRGLLREPAAPARGTLVLFHGNAGHAGHRGWYAEAFSRLGLRVLLAEYPAYGPRPGSLGETALVTDAADTVARLAREYPGPLVLAGESLGAGVAAAVAAQAPAEVSALLLITPWDRLKHVAQHHYPWAPVGLVLRDSYDSVANLKRFGGPVAVVIAEQDSIVPAHFGRALFAALPGPKRLWTQPGADHNDWMERIDAAFWPDVAAFLLAAPPSAAPER